MKAITEFEKNVFALLTIIFIAGCALMFVFSRAFLPQTDLITAYFAFLVLVDLCFAEMYFAA
jgi:hypothetical protein